ncbi:hypothetical protein PAAG_02053 [Paracoccidioides lutzii Pb01]|uniref:Uncharacterized protein n=1 Tax=Paracoccidioides lutzii (strain ATCC MYA-826 / Pb01) TaxID=502779 RepID=C1GU58_PARBA|nr:hypothetical protein PAAG_02053 [Paracoccidioides lutzii Pb01]EEH39864.2 hypothetical protein PAAG_02053 [Paracoccidioides lutzii Pb01]
MSGAGKRRGFSGGIASPPQIQRDRSRSRQNSHAQYDGTSGPGSSGHSGMNSPPGSPCVASRSPPGTLTFGSIQGQMQGRDVPLRDPARDPRRIPKITDMCRNADLPADAYALNHEIRSDGLEAQITGLPPTAHRMEMCKFNYIRIALYLSS